jgi:hypothetical protein
VRNIGGSSFIKVALGRRSVSSVFDGWSANEGGRHAFPERLLIMMLLLCVFRIKLKLCVFFHSAECSPRLRMCMYATCNNNSSDDAAGDISQAVGCG